MAGDPGFRRQLGDVLQTFLPATVAARRSVDADIGTALAAGDYGQALGAGVRQIATVPAGLASDVVGQPLAAVGSGVPGFLRGVFGLQKTTQAAPVKTAPAAPAAGVSGKPKTQAPRRDPVALTIPQVQAAQYLLTMSRPHTMREALAASGQLPAAKSLVPKDALMARAGDFVQQQYELGIAQARQQYANDPAALKEAEAQTAAEYLKNHKELLGVDLSKSAIADLRD